MGRIILVLCLLIGFAAQAQYPPGYTGINQRYDWFLGKFRGLHVPGKGADDTTFLTSQWRGAGAVVVDTVNNKFYFYSGGQWREAGGGSTNDNIGTYFRWAVPGTNNIKSFRPRFGIDLDSTATELGIIVDTLEIATGSALADSAASIRSKMGTVKSFLYVCGEAGGPVAGETEFQSDDLIGEGSILQIAVNNILETNRSVSPGYNYNNVAGTIDRSPNVWFAGDVITVWFTAGFFPDESLLFPSLTTDAESGVSGEVDVADADTEFSFASIQSPIGTPMTMEINVSGTLHIVIDYPSDYNGRSFIFTDKNAVVHNGVFTNGIVNF